MSGLKYIDPTSRYESLEKLNNNPYANKFRKLLPKRSHEAFYKAMMRAVETNIGPTGNDFLCLGMTLGDRSKVAHGDVEKLWSYTEEVFLGNRSWDDLGTREKDQLLVEMKKALGAVQKYCVAAYAVQNEIDVLYYMQETDRIDPYTDRKITITYYIVPNDSAA